MADHRVLGRGARDQAWLVHRFEPERCAATARVDKVLVRAVGAAVVAEHGLPERPHLGADWRARDGSADTSSSFATAVALSFLDMPQHDA